ncbi:hypothetical protein Ade02nite_20540 [Paractinoplanes deccanensis]|uniref:Uncharacterized protein n=1 Tax=Paractinoplanes deccanensis TaxID=113561 RepID=A0ABQ3Y0A4_9ACTN|nr:hypothetical protein [Actinoplanes deccanensis]GID73413.1 hypothetical protein Ade02nite_20540 [Actinoplanes deccanensis]
MDSRDIIATWPLDPVERLRDTLALYKHRPDDDLVIQAASADGQQVGVTFGDLRALIQQIGA